MRNTPMRLLLVEDNPDHAELIQRHLARTKPAPARVDWVTTFAAALEALRAREFDAVLLDLRLPDSELPQTLPRMLEAAPELPVVVLTSLEELDLAVDTLKQGAQDYLVKSNLNSELLSRAVYYAIERKRIQQQVQRYTHELERANRELEQFSRVVSHDLKSPLAMIHMELSWLLSNGQPLPEDAARSIQEALKTGAQMRRLVDDLLRYARTGEENGEPQQIDCNTLLATVLAELHPEIDRTGAQISADMLPTLWGNPTRLSQLFNHLLTNALQYRGENAPLIQISAEFPEPDWVFSIEDNGCGIAPEQQARVFEAFTRLQPQVAPGTGLGLAICKRVVQSHGGRIWLESQIGRGTTVYFSLPMRPPAPPAVGSASSSTPSARV